jgi:hypothetical protein
MTAYVRGSHSAVKAITLPSGIPGRALARVTLSARKLNVDNTLGHAAGVQDVIGQPQLAQLAKCVLTTVARHLRRSAIFVLPNITVRKSADLYWHVDYFFLRYAKCTEINSELLHVSVPLALTKFPLCAWPVEIIETSPSRGNYGDISSLVKIIRHRRSCGTMKAGDILLWRGGYVHRSAPAYRLRHLATLQLTVASTPRAKNLFIKHISERAMMPGEENDRYRCIVSSCTIRSQVQLRLGSRCVRSG